MPKATKVGKFRAASRASSRDVKGAPLIATAVATQQHDDDDAHVPNEKDEVVLSRGQKKRLAKREQYLNREKMVLSSLRLQRLEEQKGRIDGLDAIRNALCEASSSSNNVNSKLKSHTSKNNDGTSLLKSKQYSTNKVKKGLASAEITHMSLVLQHPSFVANPFEAIQQHLRNSLAHDAKKLQEKSRLRKEDDDKREAKKKEEKKERKNAAKFEKTRKRVDFKKNRR